MGRKRNTDSLYGLAVAFFWGLTFLSIKVAVTELKPMTLALLRFVIASALLPLIALVTHTSLALKKKDIPLLALSGFVGVTLYFFFENNGIMRLSATESSIIVGTIPLLTLMIEMILSHRKPKPIVTIGIVLSFLGVILMVVKSAAAKSSPLGYLYMIGAAVSWSAYSFLTKPLSARYPQLSITFWQIFFGMLGCIPFALTEGQSFAALSPKVIFNLLYLGIFGSALGYWFYVIMLDRMGATQSSVFINLIPVVSVIASFIVLGERLAPLQLFGGVVAIAGVYMATTTRRKGS
ncbi:MAG: DMT family transporter [Spirochaetaceae bacterium]|nr:DMT family transporter [Spirochaetaceae bacterium]